MLESDQVLARQRCILANSEQLALQEGCITLGSPLPALKVIEVGANLQQELIIWLSLASVIRKAPCGCRFGSGRTRSR